MSLNSVLKIDANETLQQTVGLATTASGSFRMTYDKTLTDGTAADQANKVWSSQRTLTASSTENLDLAGSLTDVFGATITFTKIKAIIVKAAAANVNDVQLGGAASNAFINWVANSSDIINVKPGGAFALIAPDNTAYAVTAGTGDILKVANAGAGTGVTYDICIIGVG